MSWYEENIKKHPQYASMKVVSDLDILYPPFAFCILKTFATARKEGLRVCIYETYRSQERQMSLFNQGVSKIKTNGMHHFGVATDIVFLDEKNNPSWDEKNDWKRLGEIGKELKLIWGGDWPWDKPHFQLIPATVSEQAKIIKGEYPQYDPLINQYVIDILLLYKNSQINKFSQESILEMVSYIENIGKQKVEIIPIPQEQKDKNNNIVITNPTVPAPTASGPKNIIWLLLVDGLKNFLNYIKNKNSNKTP